MKKTKVLKVYKKGKPKRIKGIKTVHKKVKW